MSGSNWDADGGQTEAAFGESVTLVGDVNAMIPLYLCLMKVPL